MKKITTLVAAMLFAAFPTLNGQDFSVSLKGGNKLYFSITDTTLKTVEVVRPNFLIGPENLMPTGSVEVPSMVTYKNVVYKVTSIGDGAMSKAEGLTSITLPSAVARIGEKAFAGCTSLEAVVFPASQPAIGAGAFDDNPLLSTISFGSDWHTVDFGLFSSSAALETIQIPAKVKKISNLKEAKTLKAISVDVNNPAFASIDGLLYSKDGKILYSCPAGRSGHVEVAWGVSKILTGAFKNCAMITSVELPATLLEFSYCEFLSCSSLESLSIDANLPIITAKWNGTPVFALRFATDQVRVYVPKKAYSTYRRSVCNKAGEYECVGGEHKETIPAGILIGKKSILKKKSSR